MGENRSSEYHLVFHPKGWFKSDLYDIIFHGPLLPTEHIDPASYPPGRTRENEGKKPSTVNDICDFIVEYINSDVLVRLILYFIFP